MEKIYVTQPVLPSLEDFKEYLTQIWENKVITNGGSFHSELEKKLADYIGVKYLSLFSNGTNALLTALQALNIEGEVITTPYSFVATSNVLWWNRINPVFVDIESTTCNINVSRIEKAITENTKAILPVHVYGIPCNVEEIQQLADKYNLKVIYDAAHAFGVNYKGQSLLNFGDLSMLSFHATKVFNTVEGGAIISHSAEMKAHIDNLKNFGILNDTTVVAPGINGKMNELQAAFGLLNLKTIDSDIGKRKLVANKYIKAFEGIDEIGLLKTDHIENYNYSYFPILIDPEYRDRLYNKLKEKNIYSRRYFYPAISNFPMYQQLASSSKLNLPVTNLMSSSILCLPIFSDMTIDKVDYVIKNIKELMKV